MTRPTVDVCPPYAQVHDRLLTAYDGTARDTGNPWTPYMLELDQPIGDRLLLDGGPWPPQQRWPIP